MGGVTMTKRRPSDPLYKTRPWIVCCEDGPARSVSEAKSEIEARRAVVRILQSLYRSPRQPQLFWDLRMQLARWRVALQESRIDLKDPAVLSDLARQLKCVEGGLEHNAVLLAIFPPYVKHDQILLPGAKLDPCVPRMLPTTVVWKDHGKTVTLQRSWLVKEEDPVRPSCDALIAELAAMEHAIGTLQKVRYEAGMIRMVHACRLLRKQLALRGGTDTASATPVQRQDQTVPASLSAAEKTETLKALKCMNPRAKFVPSNELKDVKGQRALTDPPTVPSGSTVAQVDWLAVKIYLETRARAIRAGRIAGTAVVGPVDPQIAILIQGKSAAEVAALARAQKVHQRWLGHLTTTEGAAFVARHQEAAARPHGAQKNYERDQAQIAAAPGLLWTGPEDGPLDVVELGGTE